GVLVENNSQLGSQFDSFANDSDGVLLEGDSNATISLDPFEDDGTAILVGSSSADGSFLKATFDSFVGDTVGVQNRQKGTQMNATFDWWGSASGPTNSTNPNGTGSPVLGIVNFSPWLGDDAGQNADSLYFLSVKGSAYDITPSAGNNGLNITLGGQPI